MKENRKVPALVLSYVLVVALFYAIPNTLIAFMVGFVGGGMVLINLGEQVRKDRARRQSA